MHVRNKEYEVLKHKLLQHEELITQLLKMNAATNRKVFELTEEKIQKKKVYSLT